MQEVPCYNGNFSSQLWKWKFHPSAVLRIRDINPRSEFLIPDLGYDFFLSRICIKFFYVFEPKKLILSSRKYDPGCSSRIRIRNNDFWYEIEHPVFFLERRLNVVLNCIKKISTMKLAQDRDVLRTEFVIEEKISLVTIDKASSAKQSVAEYRRSLFLRRKV